MFTTVWPRSAYAAVVVLIVGFAVAARWLYAETRSAYRAVGFNDGQIYQREQTMEKIRRTVTLLECDQLQALKPAIELLNVKAESLHMSIGGNDAVHFCR